MHFEHRAGQGGDGLAQLDDARVERAVRDALERDRAGGLAERSHHHRATGAGALLVDQRIVRAPDRGELPGGGGTADCRILIDRLVHRRGDGAHQVRPFLELRAVRDSVDANLAVVHEADAHAVTGESGGKVGRERGARGDEAVVRGGRGHHLEHRLELVARLATRVHLLLAEHELEAGRTPVELAQRGLQVGVGPGRDVHYDHPVQPARRTRPGSRVKVLAGAPSLAALFGATTPRRSTSACCAVGVR